MNSRWQLQGAKAELSALIRAAETNGPQTITRNGKPVAIVLSQTDYERISRQARARTGSLLDFFASWPELEIPNRDRTDTGRTIGL
jgi:prevent-host-death family protein